MAARAGNRSPVPELAAPDVRKAHDGAHWTHIDQLRSIPEVRSVNAGDVHLIPVVGRRTEAPHLHGAFEDGFARGEASKDRPVLVELQLNAARVDDFHLP